jgi:hypothetical protein
VACAAVRGYTLSNNAARVAVEARPGVQRCWHGKQSALSQASKPEQQAAIRREAGQRARRARLHSESQAAGAGSVCALTPSHVLAEVYHHDALLQHRARGGVAAESCCWRAVVVKKLSACITSECGSFTAAICRQTRQLISSHSGSNRSQTSAASFVGSPSSFDLGTTRRLFRNRERAKSAWVWVARATSPSSLSFPFLHPPSPLCARLKGIRKYPRSAHTQNVAVYSRPAKFTPPDGGHFNLLDDLPSCHTSSSSTGSRCCDYCHVIP